MKELNLFCFILNLCVTVLAGALLTILPVLTRKSYLFGVKIPIEQHDCPEAKSLRKRYITVCLTGTAIILALIAAQFITAPDMSLIAVMYFPLLFIAVQAAAFIPNWKQAGKLKKAKGWKVSESAFAETKSSHSRGNLSDLPWIWYIAGLILIIVSVIIALVKYPSLPDRIPTHFDVNMQPDGWSDKSIWTVVLMMPLINFSMLLIMWLCGVMFIRAKLQIDPQNPGLSFTQHRIYRRRMGHSFGLLALGLVVMFMILGLVSIFPDFNVPFWLIMSLSLVPVVPLLVVSVTSGQGGGKIKPKEIPEKAAGNQQSSFDISDSSYRGDDKHWALGMFYHNPDDPAIFVEDRFGVNLGFNYSRLPVKIGVGILLIALVAGYVCITVFLPPLL